MLRRTLARICFITAFPLVVSSGAFGAFALYNAHDIVFASFYYEYRKMYYRMFKVWLPEWYKN